MFDLHTTSSGQIRNVRLWQLRAALCSCNKCHVLIAQKRIYFKHSISSHWRFSSVCCQSQFFFSYWFKSPPVWGGFGSSCHVNVKFQIFKTLLLLLIVKSLSWHSRFSQQTLGRIVNVVALRFNQSKPLICSLSGIWRWWVPWGTFRHRGWSGQWLWHRWGWWARQWPRRGCTSEKKPGCDQSIQGRATRRSRVLSMKMSLNNCILCLMSF